MNSRSLTWLQWRADLRRFGVSAGIWLGLVGLHLALRLAETAAKAPAPWRSGSLNLLDLAVMAGLLLIPAVVVVVDSPARRDGFLHARPMPKRALWLAKAWFVLAVVVAPVTLSELVQLLAARLPFAMVLHGTVERLVFAGGMAALGGAFGAWWANIRQILAAAAGVWVGGAVWIGVWEALTDWADKPAWRFEDPTLAELMLLLWFSAGVCGIMAAWTARQAWSLKRRALAMGLLTVVGATLPGRLEWEPVPIKPADPRAAREVVQQASLRLEPSGFQVNRYDSPEPEVEVTAAFLPEPLPGARVIEWQARRVVWKTGDRALEMNLPDRPRVYYLQGQGASISDLWAWRGRLPQEVILQNEDFSVLGGQPCPFGRAGLAVMEAASEGKGRFEVELEGAVFQWHKVGEANLEPGSAVADRVTRWTIEEVVSDRNGIEARVRLRRIHFAATSDAHARREGWWGDFLRKHYAALLVDPERGWASVSRFGGYVWPNPAGALSHHRVRLRWRTVTPDGNPLPAGKPAGLRLVLLRRDWLGSARRTWTSPPVRLKRLLAGSVAHPPQPEPMSEPEFRRRLEALEPPPPEASRPVVGRYLYELLRLVEARGRRVDADDPLVRQAARYVPRHAAMFLDALPAVGWHGRRLLIEALLRGLPDESKSLVFDALPDSPELAEVILARGWEAEARSALLELVDDPRSLPDTAIQAMLLLEEPAVVPRLLAELEREPWRLQLDEWLQSLPGIGPRLEATVQRVWKRRPPVVTATGRLGAHALAMRHGLRPALEEAYRLLRLSDSQRAGWGDELINAFRQTVLLTGLGPNDSWQEDKVVAWLLKHAPEDFDYDPVRRRWVLRSAQSPSQPQPQPAH